MHLQVGKVSKQQFIAIKNPTSVVGFFIAYYFNNNYWR